MKNLKYENSLANVKIRPGKTIDKIFEKTMETCVRAQVLSNVLGLNIGLIKKNYNNNTYK